MTFLHEHGVKQDRFDSSGKIKSVCVCVCVALRVLVCRTCFPGSWKGSLMNRLNGWSARLAKTSTLGLVSAVLVANIFAACPDETPNAQSACQAMAKVCSFTTLVPDAVIPNCGGGVGPINSCGGNVETLAPGPFQPVYSKDGKTKQGPFQLCVTECPCQWQSMPNPCFNTCIPSTNVLLCQGKQGQTIVADGKCGN